MGQLLNFPSAEAFPAYAMPTVFTPELIARMSLVNQVARTLRALGYRVVEEDIHPNDDGSPIVQIDLNDLNTRPLLHLASCSVVNTNAGYERVTIDGVRVFWERSA